MPKPVTHVATTDISEMMNAGSERRMALPGFAAEFVDFPHYIIRITERIWHDKQAELCRDWYAQDCVIHTLAGDIAGADTVVENTKATLEAFPDRRLNADNVIWSDEGGGAYYSSHLITSKMTNAGQSQFGPATGKKVRIQTIAECLCKDNRIIEEWLVADNLGLVEQLGFDPDGIARAQADSDLKAGFNLIDFHAATRRSVGGDQKYETMPGSSASRIAVQALEQRWNERNWQCAGALYDYRVNGRYPGATYLYGPDDIQGWMDPLMAAIPDARIRIDHIAQTPYLGDAEDVSVRWSVAGTHQGQGRYGPPTGAPVYMLGVSHFRIIGERIRAEICNWDDLAMRRQIETARLTG